MKRAHISHADTRLRRGLVLAALLLAALALAVAALAEATPQPTPVNYDGWDADHPEREEKIRIGLYYPLDNDSDAAGILWDVRQTLKQGGFYANAPSANLMLDQNDMEAISNFWMTKTGNSYPTFMGLTYGAMDLILQPPEATQAPHEYKDILWQQGGPDLEAIVHRLVELDYMQDRSIKTYGDEVRQAVEAFCESNSYPGYYANDPEGEVRPITVELQKYILESDLKNLTAKPAVATDTKPYFLRTVEIAGLKLPMLALWGVGLVVLVAGVLAVIYLFMPSDKSSGKGKKNKVHFSITYQGKTQVIDAEITKTLKIGRGIGNFPLSLEDTQISRKHCELYYLNDALMLRDYSSNGTMVNGKSVHNAESLLASGDQIVIGNHTITVKY